MTIKELLSSSSLPLLEAERLLAFLLSCSREHLVSYPQEIVDKKIIKKFTRLQKKRKKYYPLAYLIGEKQFYGLNFLVNKNVLVPRPETEQIVDYLLVYLNNKNNKQPLNFLDIGTGSGAIIITLVKKIQDLKPKNSNFYSFYASDISISALKIAKKNAKKYGLEKNIIFKRSYLIKNISTKYLKDDKKDLIITANLPYLTKKELKAEKSISHEPKLALYGGKDGLKYYHQLFKLLKDKKLNNFILICEINPEQVEKMKKMAVIYFPKHKTNSRIMKDLTGKNRFLIINKE